MLTDLQAVLPSVVDNCFVVGGRVDGYEDLAEVIADQPAEPLAEQLEGSPMLYSSGTTGRPKGIQYPNPRRAFPSDVGMHATIANGYGITADSVYLSPAPLYHSAPLNFNTGVIRNGGTSIIMERFDPSEFLALVERHRVNVTQVVPTMFVRMLKLPAEERLRHDLSSLQNAIHAAAPCPVEVKAQMIEWWGPIVFEYYAATEGGGGTSITAEDWLEHRGSVGKSMLGVLHIVDEEGNELPPGEVGVVYFERAQGSLSFEYHKDPQKTADAHDARRVDDGRRHGVRRRGRVPLPHRSARLHDRVGRREHLPAGGREPPDHAPQGDGRRGVRRAQRGDGRRGQGGGAAHRRGATPAPSWNAS